MYLDDLPVWGMVGESYEDDAGEKKVFIYTHQKFSLSWNGDRVSRHITLAPHKRERLNHLLCSFITLAYRSSRSTLPRRTLLFLRPARRSSSPSR